MFSVLFEVQPRPERYDAYLENAKLLRPELERIDGFIENVRYRSLERPGWILSLSSWRDEKALVRWRIMTKHHEVQLKGRNEILADYHLRVGQYTRDSHVPPGEALIEQRLDETQISEATTTVLINANRPPSLEGSSPEELASWLGLRTHAAGLLSYDVYDAVLSPGDLILMASWKSHEHAEAFEESTTPPEGARIRRVRVVRDYSKYDRRESPQYYPDVPA